MHQVVDDFTADYKTTYMLYRLLRNNKESGPFTALQLKEMGLKPYDLLWTEGRGAAWQYASEIAELKDFAPVVEEQPFERLYKRKDELEMAAQPVGAAKKTKPRYRISNGQLIMVEAGNMEVGTNGIIKETAPVQRISTLPVENKSSEAPDWQNVYPQWQPQAKKELKKEEPVEIETKYTESLDDLKKRYAEKVLGDKKETTPPTTSFASVKQNIMAVVALVVLVAGGYIGYTLKKKSGPSVTNGRAKIERADIAADNQAGVQPQNDNTTPGNSSANSTAENGIQTSGEEGKSVKQVITPSANTNKTTVPPVVTTGNDKTAGQTPQKNDPGAIAKTSTAQMDKASGKVSANTGTTGTSAQVSATKPVNTPIPAPEAAKPAGKQISDYVLVKKTGGSGASVQNVKLMVSNVSDFPIDLAVVDIQYFDSKGKFQKGETMYVKDINGGNNVEVRVPDSDKSSSIKYKVSMVQADQKTLYLVAD